MNVDIIYSLTGHEYPETIQDLVNNIIYYNKKYKIIIVINTNKEIYSKTRSLLSKYDNIFILPDPWNKKAMGYDIMKAHIENAEYCYKKYVKATYFIPIASNCLFHKELNIDDFIDDKPHNSKEKITQTGWLWPKLYANTYLCQFLNSHKIYNYIGKQHEGSLYKFDGIIKIYNFLKKNKIEHFASVPTPAFPYEEIVLPSLYAHFTGINPGEICKVFWNMPNYTPTYEQIINERCPCVKRVDRAFNDPIRVQLRERANNYTDIESK